MSNGSYGQFCPVAMAAEIVCTRWTLLLLRELCLGSTRFNELRRGNPRMSPALLASRLKSLEAAGIVRRATVEGGADVSEYRLTEAGKELRPIIEAVGIWGQKWVSTEATLKDLDADLLMWDVRRNVNVEPRPVRRTNVQFSLADDRGLELNYWLVIEPDGTADLCKIDPGFDVDLFLSTSLRTMTEIWLGYTGMRTAEGDGRLALTGTRELGNNLRAWLKLSVFAQVEKRVA